MVSMEILGKFLKFNYGLVSMYSGILYYKPWERKVSISFCMLHQLSMATVDKLIEPRIFSAAADDGGVFIGVA